MSPHGWPNPPGRAPAHEERRHRHSVADHTTIVVKPACDARHRPRAPKAVESLASDGERLITFYQCPHVHWRHLRTIIVLESSPATVRLRTTAAKHVQQVDTAAAMLWKVLQVAEKTLRWLNAPEFLPAVYAGATYVDGIQQSSDNHQGAAA